jgi:hypothetical protein
MTAQETKLLNAFETTLSTTLGASGTTVTLTAVTDSASNTIDAPCYLVIEPDSATNREYVLVSSVNIGTKTLTLGDGGASYRHLKGSAATSGLSHASGSTIRYVPMAQHIEDINDRVDTVINEAGTALNTTLFLDEDDMSSNSATKGVTQQSVKAYVDTQLTAEDLDISADSGSNIAIDLDSEVLDLEGGTGIDTTTGTNKVTFAIDSTVATLTGSQALTNKTIDVDSNTVSNIEVDNLKSGVLDTDLSSTAGTDTTLASAKAIKTYVDAQTTAQDLDITDGSTTSAVDLDSQTMTIEGTSNEVEVALSSQTFTIGLPSSITANLVGNVTGNVSGTAGGLSATLAVASGGTGATSMTDKAVVITQDSGTDTLSSVAMDANGELLIGGTSGPAVATLTAGTGVTITNADGSITIAASDVGDITGVTAGTGLTGGGTSGTVTLNVADLAVAQGGTGATSFADKAVIITQDSGTDTLAAAAMDANGELLIGGTSGPAVGTLTAGSNITITNADGGITIAAAGGDVTASSTTTFTNKTIDADGTGNSISNIDIGNMTSAVVVTESDGIASNDNDTTLPTSAAVKDFVDSQAAGVSLGLVLALS